MYQLSAAATGREWNGYCALNDAWAERLETFAGRYVYEIAQDEENKTEVKRKKKKRPEDSNIKQAAVWEKWRAFGFILSLSNQCWVCRSV